MNDIVREIENQIQKQFPEQILKELSSTREKLQCPQLDRDDAPYIENDIWETIGQDKQRKIEKELTCPVCKSKSRTWTSLG